MRPRIEARWRAGTLAAAAAWRCTGRWAAAPGTRPAGGDRGEIVPSAIRAAVAARCGAGT